MYGNGIPKLGCEGENLFPTRHLLESRLAKIPFDNDYVK